jgi:hypothetical protein
MNEKKGHLLTTRVIRDLMMGPDHGFDDVDVTKTRVWVCDDGRWFAYCRVRCELALVDPTTYPFFVHNCRYEVNC